jgi:SAM-dependent methyltransferase
MLEATALAEEEHFWFKGLRRNARRLLSRALAGRPASLVIDCGTGTGRNLDWLAEFGPAIGVERSPVGLQLGQSRGRRQVQATVTQLPFRDASADIVTSFDVLYCLDDEDERRAVAEMWRVLRPGGIALLNVAALDILHGSHSTLTHEVRRYTRARLRERLERAGFEVERMTFTNMTIFPVALAVRMSERLTGGADQASDADLRVPAKPINALFDAALRLESRLMGLTNLPIGTSLMCVARKP